MAEGFPSAFQNCVPMSSSLPFQQQEIGGNKWGCSRSGHGDVISDAKSLASFAAAAWGLCEPALHVTVGRALEAQYP